MPSKHPKPASLHRPWPKFSIPPLRRTFETEEQWAIFERDRARHFEAMGIFLGSMQWVCSRLGNHKRCALRTCRRKGRCAGRRPEHSWNDGFLFPLVPPCEPTDAERVYQLRDEVNQMIWRSAHGHKPNPPPPPVRYATVPLVFSDNDMHETEDCEPSELIARSAKGRKPDRASRLLARPRGGQPRSGDPTVSEKKSSASRLKAEAATYRQAVLRSEAEHTRTEKSSGAPAKASERSEQNGHERKKRMSDKSAKGRKPDRASDQVVSPRGGPANAMSGAARERYS